MLNNSINTEQGFSEASSAISSSVLVTTYKEGHRHHIEGSPWGYKIAKAIGVQANKIVTDNGRQSLWVVYFRAPESQSSLPQTPFQPFTSVRNSHIQVVPSYHSLHVPRFEHKHPYSPTLQQKNIQTISSEFILQTCHKQQKFKTYKEKFSDQSWKQTQCRSSEHFPEQINISSPFSIAMTFVLTLGKKTEIYSSVDISCRFTCWVLSSIICGRSSVMTCDLYGCGSRCQTSKYGTV